MPASHRLLVGSEFLDSESRLQVVNPFTGALFAEVPLGTRGTIERAISAAAEAFPQVRSRPAHERAELLLAIARGIENRAGEFAATIVAEAGKPIMLAEAEVARAITTFTAAAEESRRQQGELLDVDAFPSGAGHLGWVRRFPLGVISAITPFNFPLNLVAHKIAPCLATGNTMVLKPAPKAPVTALLLGEVLVGAGMPTGQVNIITCTNEDAALLVTDPRVKKLSFTGSSKVGWRLKELSGRKRVTLELGGNAGVIVHADANLAAAIPVIATGGFAYAGQSCISVQRVLVHNSIYERFRDEFLAYVRDMMITGDPQERGTIVGPMVNAEALAEIGSRIDAALHAGAKLLAGGKLKGPCLEATVLEDVPPHLDLSTREAFAPVVTLHRYDGFEDAIRMVNDSTYGLQAGVFTSDLHLAFRAYEALEVGGVLINQVPTFRTENMPYGGIKDSGFGREGVRWAMDEMTEPKSLIMRLG
ncbi:MAG TPA: aldehyde dehydrogenase family protein [Chthoniobacteraceae bacterium]